GNDDAILRVAAVGSPQEYSDKPAISMAEDLAEYKRMASKWLHEAAARCSPGALRSLANQYRVGALVGPYPMIATSYLIAYLEAGYWLPSENRHSMYVAPTCPIYRRVG